MNIKRTLAKIARKRWRISSGKPLNWTPCACSISEKRGELTTVLKSMGRLWPRGTTPVMGQLANEVRAALEQALEEMGSKLEEKLLWTPV